jgi:hypothetical protein
MIFDRTWRRDRLEQRIAGKKAKLAATQELFSSAKSLPGRFALDLTQLPQEIAELEVELKQLTAPNSQGEPPRAALSREVGSTAELGVWLPIETAPRDGSHVQLFRPEIQFVGYYGGADSGWHINAPGLPSLWPSPTHWAPLRKAPNVELTSVPPSDATKGG